MAIVRNDPDVPSFVTAVLGVLADHYTDYELVLVDDGSIDETPRWSSGMLGHQECMRLVRLSREFGNDVAITAGLDSAIGDFAVVMLAACDPPETIPAMVAMAETGSGCRPGSVPEAAGRRMAACGKAGGSSSGSATG